MTEAEDKLPKPRNGPPAPAESDEAASPTDGNGEPEPASGPPKSLREGLAGKWQIPLLLAGVLLLLSGLPRLHRQPPGPTVDDQLADARQAFLQGQFPETIKALDRLAAGKMSESQRSQMLLIRGLANCRLADAAADAGRQALAAQAAADLDGAVQAAGSVEALDARLVTAAEFLIRRGQAHLWAGAAGGLDRAEADLLQAAKRLGPGQDELRKQLITLLWHISPANVHQLLDEMVARADLDPSDRVWAIGCTAKLLAEENRLDEAVRLLEGALAQAAAGSGQDSLEIELARVHYEAAIDSLKPLKPAEREHHLDQAQLLLEAVRKRRTSPAGEEELRVDAELDWLWGEVSLLKGDPPEAEKAFAAVLRRFPTTRFARAAQWGLARSAARNAKFDLALEAYQIVVDELKHRPEDPLIDRRAVQGSLLQLAEQLRRGEQWEPAYRFLVLLYDILGPGTAQLTPADVKEKQAVVLRRLALDEKQRADRITRQFAPWQVPTSQPEEVARLIGRARGHLRLAADAFLTAARMADVTDKRSGDDLEMAATCYDEAGETARAIAVLNRFIAEYPGDRARLARAIFNLAKSYQASGDFTGAVLQYRRLVNDFPQTPDANKSLVSLAQCLKAMRQFDEAEKVLDSVLSNDEVFTPESAEYADALYELARLKYERGQYRQSIPRFDEALQRDPNNRHAAYCRYYLADSYRLSGLDMDASIKSAKTMLEKQQLTETRAQWLRQAGALFDEVVATFEARPQLDEVDWLCLRNSYFFRADCLFDLGQYDEAIQRYDLAALKYHGQPEAVAAYVQIVNCYYLTARPDQARAAIERIKLLLKKLPAGSFASRPLPLTKDYIAQWLDWMGKSDTW